MHISRLKSSSLNSTAAPRLSWSSKTLFHRFSNSRSCSVAIKQTSSQHSAAQPTKKQQYIRNENQFSQYNNRTATKKFRKKKKLHMQQQQKQHERNPTRIAGRKKKKKNLNSRSSNVVFKPSARIPQSSSPPVPFFAAAAAASHIYYSDRFQFSHRSKYSWV